MRQKVYLPFVKPVPISELPETTTLEPGSMFLETEDGKTKKIKTEVFSRTIISGIKGEATPSSSPTAWVPGNPDLYEKWDIKTAGTYINFLNGATPPQPIEVTVDDLKNNYVQIWVKNGVSQKMLSVKPVGGSVTAVFEPTNSVDPQGGKQIYDFLRPATYEEFINRENRAITASEFFEVIGDYVFNSNDAEMLPPYSGFNINNAVTSIPANSFWTYNRELYSTITDITSVDVRFVVAGTFNIYIYSLNDLSVPDQVIPINVSGPGIYTHNFTTPLDADNFIVCISSGAGYYLQTGTPAKVSNIINGVLTPQPNGGVVLGMVIKGVINGSKTIIEQINELKVPAFTNNIYSKKRNTITDISKESSNSTFAVDADGLKIISAGIGNGVCLEKQINLNKRYIELKVQLFNDTKFYLGTQFVENNVGKAYCVIDSVNKSLTIYNLDSVSTVAATVNFTFDIVNNREYIVRMFKLDDITRFELIDTVSTQNANVQVSQLGQFDKYKFGYISSTSVPVISSIAVKSITPERPYVGFYGDSITECNTVGSTSNVPYYKDGFPTMIGEKLKKPFFVSGRSAGTIDGVLERMKSELPALLPKYVFVTIGTNGQNTEAKLNQLVDYCQSLNIKVILNLIPLFDSSTAAKNTLIQSVVDSRGLMSVKMNVATSVNSDGVTKDNTLFASEGGMYIHPNKPGNVRIYERSLIDVPDLFSEAGVF